MTQADKPDYVDHEERSEAVRNLGRDCFASTCAYCGCKGYHSEFCGGFAVNDPAAKVIARLVAFNPTGGNSGGWHCTDICDHAEGQYMCEWSSEQPDRSDEAYWRKITQEADERNRRCGE